MMADRHVRIRYTPIIAGKLPTDRTFNDPLYAVLDEIGDEIKKQYTRPSALWDRHPVFRKIINKNPKNPRVTVTLVGGHEGSEHYAMLDDGVGQHEVESSKIRSSQRMTKSYRYINTGSAYRILVTTYTAGKLGSSKQPLIWREGWKPKTEAKSLYPLFDKSGKGKLIGSLKHKIHIKARHFTIEVERTITKNKKMQISIDRAIDTILNALK